MDKFIEKHPIIMLILLPLTILQMAVLMLVILPLFIFNKEKAKKLMKMVGIYDLFAINK